MTQENIHQNAKIQQFLLGEMPEEERSAFEKRFITDADLFEQISVAEDDLIESYVRDTLDTETRKRFERYFLATEKRRERVRFTRVMLEKLSGYKENTDVKKAEPVTTHISFGNSIRTFFKNPIFAPGAVLTILFLAFGSWFLLKNSNNPEISRRMTPTPTAMSNEKIQSDTNRFVESNQTGATNSNIRSPERIEINKNGAGQKNEIPNKTPSIQKEEKITVNPVLALFAGTIRSEGKTRELTLPQNAGNVLLQLNLEGNDYKTYQAELVTPDGESVLKRVNLAARNSKINFSVPAERLRRSDYLVKLSGLNSNNETESVADYSFRINRR